MIAQQCPAADFQFHMVMRFFWSENDSRYC